MKKQIILVSGIILLLVLGVLWYSMRRTPLAETQVPNTVEIVQKQINEENTAKTYTVRIQYPQLVQLTGQETASTRINKIMVDVATRRGEDFKKNLAAFSATAPATDVGPLPGGNMLALTYEVQLPKKPLGNLVSILFLETTYYQGAAHPSHTYFSYIFDLTTGREIKLADVFAADDLYVPLSQLATRLLRESFVRQDVDEGGWFPEGAAPKEENFQVYTVDDNGLVLYFNEYQVAPYAAGAQKVIIPFDDLRPLQPRLWN